MIVTVTPNPAVDQTLWVSRLVPGSGHRARESQFDPAGKGINVSRMVHRLGWPTIAFGFGAGETGLLIEHKLAAERVPFHFVHVAGTTRVNVNVVEDTTGQTTVFYGVGPTVAPVDATDLRGLMEFWLQAGRVLVLAGSLPPGLPHDSYAEWTRFAHARGAKVIVDADGDVLSTAISACPDVIKPNVAEAEVLLKRSLRTEAEIVDAARELEGRGIGAVVISRGAEGLVCASRGRTWRVLPPQVERKSTIGSGDSLVAGIAVALARGEDAVAGLALGTAAGAATAMTAGTALGLASEIDELLPRVRVEPIADPEQPLLEA
ncbi:MAG TPA: 1-phosphofructokinase [bacterium]|nr:1-phosphofructokinase [bacterium]